MIKAFLRYYFHYTLNYTWTISSIVAIYVFIWEWFSKSAPIFGMMTLVPFFLLIFNILTEYNRFRGYTAFSDKKLIIYTYLACLAVVLTIVGIMLF